MSTLPLTIHVDRPAIGRNAQHGAHDPVLTVIRADGTIGSAHQAVIRGADGEVVARFVYTGDQTPTGASVWLEVIAGSVDLLTTPPPPA